jgi:hypothetical protein
MFIIVHSNRFSSKAELKEILITVCFGLLPLLKRAACKLVCAICDTRASCIRRWNYTASWQPSQLFVSLVTWAVGGGMAGRVDS